MHIIITTYSECISVECVTHNYVDKSTDWMLVEESLLKTAKHNPIIPIYSWLARELQYSDWNQIILEYNE